MTSSVQTVLLGASLIDVNPGLTFWTMVTFILVAILLRKFAWGPILKFIQDRENAIAETIQKAKEEREEAAKLVAEQKAEVTRIRHEMAEQSNRNAVEMDRLREEMLKKSRQESEELLATARRNIADEMEMAKIEVRKEAVEIALAAAEHLMKTNGTKEEQQRLVASFIQATDKGDILKK